MSELDPQRFAHLRALLNEAQPDATAIALYIQQWPDDRGRRIAQSYAEAYFQRHVTSSALEALQTGKMYFDTTNQHLYTSDGVLIKQLGCPKTMCWDELVQIDERDIKRHCDHCTKHVINTRDLSDKQVHALIQYDPTACLYINQTHGNVTFVSPSDERTTQNTRDARYYAVTPNMRIIKTARTAQAIQLAVDQGYWPVPKVVVASGGKIGSFMQVWQHRQTGKLSIQTDVRYTGIEGDYREWALVIENHIFDDSSHFPEPIAAYIVPRDIQVGERVFLEDVIENFKGSIHHGSRRLKQAEAIWNGVDFSILYDEESDVALYLG